MATPLYSLLAIALTLYGQVSGQVTDDTSTRSYTLGTVATTTYHRVLLADPTGTGTSADPCELLLELQALLGGTWSVRLGSTGRVAITCADSEALLTLPDWLYFALGGPSPSDSPTQVDCTGAGYTFAHAPLGCLLLASREDDQGWQPNPGQQAYSRLANGVVYGFDASDYQLTRTVRAALLPLTPAKALELGAYQTALLPDDTARWQTVPVLAPATYPPPYTLHEWLVHARGRPIACALGTLPRVLSGAELAFDLCYLDPATMGAEGAVRPRVPYVEQYSSRDKLVLARVGNGSVATRLLTEAGEHLVTEAGERLAGG